MEGVKGGPFLTPKSKWLEGENGQERKLKDKKNYPKKQPKKPNNATNIETYHILKKKAPHMKHMTSRCWAPLLPPREKVGPT
jgi:hypothetical protein